MPLPESVSAVLPAFNEEAVIATTVRRTHAALVATGIPTVEVIVVDDGSADRTAAECAQVAGELANVRVISHGRNRGYGCALRTGFEAAQGSAVFLMDSDGQFDPEEIRLLLEHWDGRTLVCGDRARRSDTLIRRANNAAFFALVRARFGRIARDVNCGFKLFPRAAGRGLSARGALISTELILTAQAHGYRVVDVPVHHAPRLTGAPTGARPGVVLRAFVELWRLDRRMRDERHRAGVAGAHIT